MEDLSEDDWNRQLATNLTGLSMPCKFALPHLKKSKGRLALVDSVRVFISTPQTGAYCASKAAVLDIGDTLLAELKGKGVCCTVVHPGFVESNIALMDNEGRFHPEKKDLRPANLMWPTEKKPPGG